MTRVSEADGPERDEPEPEGSNAPGDDASAHETAAGIGAGLAQAAERSGLGGFARDEALTARELLGALGGVRGLAEAILPGLVFLAVYAVWGALVPALAASVGLAVVFTVARLVARTPVTQAVAGLVGAGASAALALWTGRGEDNFVIGLWTNGAYATAILISLLVGWPLLGLAVGFLMGDGLAWKHDRKRYRAMQLLTLLWLGLFVARLAVQLPLYFAANVEGLALTRLLMGVPLYAVLLVLSWLVVRAVYPAGAARDE
ncbi:DUF3159 domain-containing protein [Agromyces sp. SYSU T00194]|uniref:DUF3159 domain-containing protein n=1 Tax=Agromyces chitinivorans TaxID=3158560 RepID=UPI0033956846